MPAWATFDEAGTRAARKSKLFVDRRSWLGTRKDGSRYIRLHGADKTAQRERLYLAWDGNCAICGKPVRGGDEDLEHNWSLGRGGDDSDANLRFTHGMKSEEPCHRDKTNREIHLRTIPWRCGHDH